MSNYQIGFTIGASTTGALAGLKSVSGAVSDLGRQTESINQRIANIGDRKAHFGSKLAKETAIVGVAIGAFVYPAMKVNKELANIRKGMGDINDVDFSSFKNELFSVGDRIPQIGLGITNIAKSISQAGIAGNDNILSLSETIGKLSYAFELAGDQAAGMSLKVIDTYKLSANAFGETADVLNMFSNNETQKLLDITSVMSGIGTGAQGFGLNANEAAMFSTVGLSTGQDSSKVMAGLNIFFQKLNNLDGQGKEFHSMLKSIGLSSSAIKDGQRKDSAQAAIDVLAQIANFDKDTQVQIMSSFGDNNGVLKDLLKEIPTMRSQLARIRDVDTDGNTEYTGSLTNHFNKMAETPSGEFDALKNDLLKLSVIIGESLLPPMQSLIKSVTQVVNYFADWAKANPKIIDYGLKTIAVVAGLRLGFLALNFASLGVITNIFKIVSAFQTASVFLMANPIVAIIAGIAIAATLIYTYWEPITAFFKNLWTRIKGFFNSGIGNISATIINWSPIGLFYKAFAKVLNWFGFELPEDFTGFGSLIISNFTSAVRSVWNSTKTVFDSIATEIRGPFDSMPMEMQTFGVDIIEGLVNGAESIWNTSKSFFTGVTDFIKDPYGSLSPEMQAFGMDIIDNLVGGAKTIWEGTKAFFTGVVDFIKNPFSTIKEEFNGYGENIMDGLVGGINSKLKSTKETIVNVGNSIKGWFTSVLGIKSPSRVFMEYGKNITEGTAIGIESGLPQTKQAINKLADDLKLESFTANNLTDTLKLDNHITNQLVGNISLDSYIEKPLASKSTPPTDVTPIESPILMNNYSNSNTGQSMVNHIQFSPNITISGRADVENIKEGVRLTFEEFKRFMKQWERESSRRSFS